MEIDISFPNRREGFFDSNGVKLHFIKWAGTGKPLLLLSGLGDNAQQYNSLAPKLAHQFNVVALTRRGHGRSDQPESGYALEFMLDDISRFLDYMEIDTATLVGHSFGGIESTFFAQRFPERVAAIVYLDALFPKLEPEPDLSGDPVWSDVPNRGPNEGELTTRKTYLAYYKQRRPDWVQNWCAAIEADLMDRVTVQEDGRIINQHNDDLMNRILKTIMPPYPTYAQIAIPQLAIVPDGDFHPSVPKNASGDLRRRADQFWLEKLRPWVQQRTETFLRESSSARVVELDTPYHHVFHAREDEVVRAINDFLQT